MINLQAKNKILSLYREGATSYGKVKMDEYKQLYYAIRSQLASGNQEWVNAVGKFLLHGVMAYDRFIGSRPQYVDDDLYDMFCHFLSSLQKLDGKFNGRTCTFHLDNIMWLIFRDCSLRPCDEELKVVLDQYENDLTNIVIPTGDERIAENLKRKKEYVQELINDIREGRIRTRIHTSLPSSFSDTDAKVSLLVDGVKVRVTICNQSQGSSLPGIKIEEGSTLTTSGPSGWTTTCCDLDIEAECLMDGLDLRPRVTLQKEEDKRYWTAAFDITYRVVTALWMYFQQKENRTASWPPLPNDIHYLSFKVGNDTKEYDGEYTTNPALVYHVKSLKKEPHQYTIEDEDGNWSSYAYRFAKVYAESGQLKEAIFWLNVSVEALVEEFVRKVATTKEKLAVIEGEVRRFEAAEEILAEQFPEMEGKVKWPDTVIHTSVFTKLKRAVQMSDMASVQKDIIKKYSQVNAKRNALFHGDSVIITVEDVEKAFKAYVWLKEKL